MNPNRTLQELGFKALASRDETFFHILPTLTRSELERLILLRPIIWARYRAYLKSL